MKPQTYSKMKIIFRTAVFLNPFLVLTYCLEGKRQQSVKVLTPHEVKAAAQTDRVAKYFAEGFGYKYGVEPSGNQKSMCWGKVDGLRFG